MHIGHVESTRPNNMAKLRDSKHAEHWIRVMKGELRGHVTNGIFSDENIPQGQ